MNDDSAAARAPVERRIAGDFDNTLRHVFIGPPGELSAKLTGGIDWPPARISPQFVFGSPVYLVSSGWCLPTKAVRRLALINQQFFRQVHRLARRVWERRGWLIAFALGWLVVETSQAGAPSISTVRFPHDRAVVDVQRDLGAKGDGVTDDTVALQKGIDLSSGVGGAPSKVLYLPNGTYRISRTLVVSSPVGPWIYGESRDGVVVRLVDRVNDTNCTAALRTHPLDHGKSSADWFMRSVHNLTINVGDNPGVDGIRWYANNSGILKNVRVIGHGKVGINAGFLEQNGPNLIQDTTVEGFQTGVLSAWIWGETVSRLTIRNCQSNGIVVSANAIGIEDLTVENTPIAIRNEVPNRWDNWGGVIALVGGHFTASGPAETAILNQGVLYARNVQTRGFKMALKSSSPSGDERGPAFEEYVSHPRKSLFDAPTNRIALEIKAEPELPWEEDPSNWVCANDYGATPGDNLDDSVSLQHAIDDAASHGKTTVFLRGVGGGDPNWYNLNREIHVHGSVRHILGLGFGRVVDDQGSGRIIVDDQSAKIVKIQNLQAFGGRPVQVENRSMSRTLVIESCDLKVVGSGTGEIFLTDCPSHVELRHSGQKCWARQLNPEGDSTTGLVDNAGGDLWILGAKFEGAGVRFRTSNGGRTEVLGMFLYDPGNLDEKDLRPIFDVDDGALMVAGLREISFGTHTYSVKVRERRGTVTRIVDKKNEGGWIGWALYDGRNPSHP